MMTSFQQQQKSVGWRMLDSEFFQRSQTRQIELYLINKDSIQFQFQQQKNRSVHSQILIISFNNDTNGFQTERQSDIQNQKIIQLNKILYNQYLPLANQAYFCPIKNIIDNKIFLEKCILIRNYKKIKEIRYFNHQSCIALHISSHLNSSIIIIIMRRQYIIQMGKDQPYPFSGHKHNFNSIFVRTDLDTFNSQDYQQISRKIDILTKISSPFIIQVVRVIEVKDKKFTLDYEYVAVPLKDAQKMIHASSVSLIKEKLQHAVQVLALNGLRYEFKIEDIGITEDQELKLFTGLNFKIVDEKNRQNLAAQYQAYILKFIEANFNNVQMQKNNSFNLQFSNYSVRLDKKLNKIEQKIERRRKRKNSSSASSNSSRSKQKSTHYQSNMVAQSLMSRKSSNASLTENIHASPANLGNEKIHKSSFGDYDSPGYCLNESKEDFLSKRISAALQKTQAAFKTFDKSSRKKPRW